MFSSPARMYLEYNGWLFEESLQPPRITVRPIYDRSQRTVMYNVHSIELSFHVFDSDGAGASTDDFLEDVRKLLTQPAGHLVIQGIGYDDIDVNRPGGGGTRDCIWGPRPQIVSCRQVADQACWHVSWRCDVALADRCPERPGSPDSLLEWNYQVAYSIDQDGLTTRSVSGTVAIPQTRNSVDDRRVRRTIDTRREEVMAAQRIPNFRRIPGQWNVHDDKCRADFSFQDIQFPSQHAPPPGVVEIRARHSMRTNGNSWFQYLHTISADIRMTRTMPKSLCWRYFRELYQARRAQARVRSAALIPLSISIDEDIYSMMTSFAINYLVSIPNPNNNGNLDANAKSELALREVLNNSGLWRDPPNADWSAWDAIMRPVYGPRGIAGLRLESDYIVDLCDTKQSLFPPQNQKVLRSGNPLPDNNRPLGDKPPAEKSWVKYSPRVKVMRKDETAQFSTLPFNPVDYRPRNKKIDDDSGYRSDYVPPSTAPFIFQRRANPLYTIVFEGEALRAAHAIDQPTLRTVGGMATIPMNDDSCFFETAVIADFLTPMCAARWRLIYALENIPTTAILPPAGPVHGGLPGSDRSLNGYATLG